jgi:hemoglobin-like flavoprotein
MGCALAIPQVNIEDYVSTVPSYYRDIVLEKEDLENCRRVWENVLVNRTPAFTKEKRDSKFPFSTCVDWFSSLLYENLFLNCPHTRHLFRKDNTIVGNRTLAKMISKCLFMLELITHSDNCSAKKVSMSMPSPVSTCPYTRANEPNAPACSTNECNSVLSAAEAVGDGSPTSLTDGCAFFAGSTPRSSFSTVASSTTRSSSCDLARFETSGSNGSPKFSKVSGKIHPPGPLPSPPPLDANTVKNADMFSNIMRKIALSHHQMGVRVSDFCHFGDAMLTALRVVCGETLYTEAADQSWRKMYSAMLRALLVEMPGVAAPIPEEENSEVFSGRARSHTF